MEPAPDQMHDNDFYDFAFSMMLAENIHTQNIQMQSSLCSVIPINEQGINFGYKTGIEPREIERERALSHSARDFWQRQMNKSKLRKYIERMSKQRRTNETS